MQRYIYIHRIKSERDPLFETRERKECRQVYRLVRKTRHIICVLSSRYSGYTERKRTPRALRFRRKTSREKSISLSLALFRARACPRSNSYLFMKLLSSESSRDSIHLFLYLSLAKTPFSLSLETTDANEEEFPFIIHRVGPGIRRGWCSHTEALFAYRSTRAGEYMYL